MASITVTPIPETNSDTVLEVSGNFSKALSNDTRVLVRAREINHCGGLLRALENQRHRLVQSRVNLPSMLLGLNMAIDELRKDRDNEGN